MIELAVGLLIVVVVGIMAYTLIKTPANSSLEQEAILEPETSTQGSPTDIPGTILIQAQDGIINDFGVNGEGMTYLAETSRGFEAYLAVEGAKVTIPFTSETAGQYELWIYTSDDGTFEDGDRNVTIFVNNSSKLLYQHKSEDTQGMVWQKVGTATILEGDNMVSVTKEQSTYAAFSFTSIKFIPTE